MTDAAPEHDVDSTTIRTATLDDLPVIRRLFEESVYEGQTRINDTGADIDKLVDGVNESTKQLMVMERELNIQAGVTVPPVSAYGTSRI